MSYSVFTRFQVRTMINLHRQSWKKTGKKLGIRLKESRMEVDSKIKQTFTRSQNTAAFQNTTSPLLLITLFKRTMWSIGRRQQWLTESQTVPPGRSRSLFASVRKMNKPGRRQLSTQPYIRPLSSHDVQPSCQDPKELSTSFLLPKASERDQNN